MSTGRIRFFDADRGFGSIMKNGGGNVFIQAGVLSRGVTSLKPGQRVEFRVIEGRRGEQTLSTRLVETPPSLPKASRRKARDMAVVIENLIKMLSALSNGYRHDHHPGDKRDAGIAAVLQRVADELEL